MLTVKFKKRKTQNHNNKLVKFEEEKKHFLIFNVMLVLAIKVTDINKRPFVCL